MRVRLGDGTERNVLADKLWAAEAPGVNTTVLDDIVSLLEQGGLPFDEDEEDAE